uniref:Uncharacterized protein n=1 Tax=Cannabis sativa TaxID=3483 RepID=A0A803QSU2_CANSA
MWTSFLTLDKKKDNPEVLNIPCQLDMVLMALPSVQIDSRELLVGPMLKLWFAVLLGYRCPGVNRDWSWVTCSQDAPRRKFIVIPARGAPIKGPTKETSEKERHSPEGLGSRPATGFNGPAAGSNHAPLVSSRHNCLHGLHGNSGAILQYSTAVIIPQDDIPETPLRGFLRCIISISFPWMLI